MLVYSHLADTTMEELALAWNKCWKGYFYETHYTAPQMKAWLEKCQIDLSHSVALMEAERIIGFSLLAVENHMGWIAGTCIDPEFRGRHLFEPLMLQQLIRAEKLQLKGVRLEVLSQNHAGKIYQRIGFQKTRELYVYRYHKGNHFSGAPQSLGCSLREAGVADYFQARKEAGFNPPWQRREEYLKRYTSLRAWLNSEGSSGILMTKESPVLLDAWTMAWEQVEKLIGSILLITQGEFILTNQPKDWLTAYLGQHGLCPNDIQHEMMYSMHKKGY